MALNTILVMCSFIQIPQIVLAGLLRSEGATKQAMQGILIGTGLNIILDYFFIMQLKWGIAGAAWATILGNLGGGIFYLFYFRFSGTLLSIHWQNFKPTKEMIGNIVPVKLDECRGFYYMGSRA